MELTQTNLPFHKFWNQVLPHFIFFQNSLILTSSLIQFMHLLHLQSYLLDANLLSQLHLFVLHFTLSLRSSVLTFEFKFLATLEYSIFILEVILEFNQWIIIYTIFFLWFSSFLVLFSFCVLLLINYLEFNRFFLIHFNFNLMSFVP